MPIQPVKTVLATEAEIAKICEKAQEEIFAKVLAHYRKNPGNAWSGKYLVDLEKTVKALYRQLGIDIGAQFKQGLPQTMREFYDRAAAQLKTAGKRNAILGGPDTGRVNYFLNNSYEQIAMRTTRMSFDHIKQLRTISAEVLRTASITGATRQQVTKQLLDKAMQIPGFKFTDNGGRVWKEEAYFKMLARTELMNAGRTAYDEKCAAEGCDVMMLDYSGKCCDACGGYEGALFSLTGATPGLPTKDDLTAAGVFHPNCTHSYSAVPDYVIQQDFTPEGKRRHNHTEEQQPKTKPAAATKPAKAQAQQIQPAAQYKALSHEEHVKHRQEQLQRAQQARLQRECAIVGAKPIKGRHSSEQDLAAANPHYDRKIKAYSYNCQRCVSTYEARRRGIDVTAKPIPANDTLQYGFGWAKAYKNGPANIVDCSAARGNGARANVEKQVLASPEGSRFIVRVGWKGNPRSGHVFIAENDHGTVRFIDPQPNGRDDQKDCSGYWNYASGKMCSVLRVDNLKFTDTLKDCCEEVKK